MKAKMKKKVTFPKQKRINDKTYINDYFNQVYLINLEKRADRLKESKNELKLHNIKAKTFKAVDGIFLYKGIPKAGAIGCTKSHLSIIREIIENGYQRTLILEDDISFNVDVQEIFSNAIEAVPEWEMLYFGGNHYERPEEIESNKHFVRLKETYSTFAYAITLEFAKEIYPLLESESFDTIIDIFYAKMHRNKKVFCFKEKLCTQRPSFSDVQNRFTDYSKLL